MATGKATHLLLLLPLLLLSACASYTMSAEQLYHQISSAE